MENLRRHYRQSFRPGERICVELRQTDDGASLWGEIADLAVGGMSVHLDDPGIALALGSTLHAQFFLPARMCRVDVDCRVVHGRKHGDGCRYGLVFLPPKDQVAHSQRDRVLWMFLLDEQRRARQKEWWNQ